MPTPGTGAPATAMPPRRREWPSRPAREPERHPLFHLLFGGVARRGPRRLLPHVREDAVDVVLRVRLVFVRYRFRRRRFDRTTGLDPIEIDAEVDFDAFLFRVR